MAVASGFRLNLLVAMIFIEEAFRDDDIVPECHDGSSLLAPINDMACETSHRAYANYWRRIVISTNMSQIFYVKMSIGL